MTTRSGLFLTFVMAVPLACGGGGGPQQSGGGGGPQQNGGDGGDGATTTGGAGGVAGTAGAGVGGGGSTGTGTGGSPAPHTCAIDSSSRCSCHDGTPSDQDPACTSTSVATGADEVGVCCQGPSVCQCDAYVCRYDAAQDICACGAVGTIDGEINGATVSTCPMPDEQRKCCYQPDSDECTCSSADCMKGWFLAFSCSIGRVAICGDDAGYKVSRCSNADQGAGGRGGGGGAGGAGGAGGIGGEGGTGGTTGEAVDGGDDAPT